MKELSLKLTGAANIKPIINIDGNNVKFKKNKFDSFETKFSTDKDRVEISIYKFLEINGKLWFLMSMIFFIISLFGILDVRYERSCIVLDCKFVINLKEKSDIVITFNSLKDKGKAVEIKTDCDFEEISNNYYVDLKAKKRLKILLAVKILLWIALLATIIGILISKY